MFTCVRVPKEILTDQGMPFMSRVTKELCKLFKTHHLLYYSVSLPNLVERFKTLKGFWSGWWLQMSKTGTAYNLISCLPYEGFPSPPWVSPHLSWCTADIQEVSWILPKRLGSRRQEQETTPFKGVVEHILMEDLPGTTSVIQQNTVTDP